MADSAMPVSPPTDYIVLYGCGLILPRAAIELALDLERRGLQLRSEDGAVLFVGPRDRLTDDDRIGIRRWKTHLLALLHYLDQADAGGLQ